MYRIIDYWTRDLIGVSDDYSSACEVCYEHDGAEVETEDGKVLYENISLPF